MHATYIIGSESIAKACKCYNSDTLFSPEK